jgi:hypothetical protein
MKTVLAYVAVMILATSLALILLAPKAHAASSSNAFTTQFALVMNTGDVKHTFTNPTPEGKRISLPIAFDNIDCVFSDTVAKDDDLIRVLSCTDQTATFRTMVSCSAVKADRDSSTMAISADENNTVFFMLACETSKKAPTKPAPTSV